MSLSDKDYVLLLQGLSVFIQSQATQDCTTEEEAKEASKIIYQLEKYDEVISFVKQTIGDETNVSFQEVDDLFTRVLDKAQEEREARQTSRFLH